jgi:DNA processing protein
VQQWQDVVAEFPQEIAAGILPPESGKKGSAAAGAADVPAGLSDAERVVYGLLKTDDPVHIDALAESSRLPVSELSAALLGLEMRDLVRQLPGRCFVRRM